MPHVASVRPRLSSPYESSRCPWIKFHIPDPTSRVRTTTSHHNSMQSNLIIYVHGIALWFLSATFILASVDSMPSIAQSVRDENNNNAMWIVLKFIDLWLGNKFGNISTFYSLDNTNQYDSIESIRSPEWLANARSNQAAGFWCSHSKFPIWIIIWSLQVISNIGT